MKAMSMCADLAAMVHRYDAQIWAWRFLIKNVLAAFAAEPLAIFLIPILQTKSFTSFSSRVIYVKN